MISNDCIEELRKFQADYRDQHGEEMPDEIRRDFIDAYFDKHDTSDCNPNHENYEPSFAEFNQ